MNVTITGRPRKAASENRVPCSSTSEKFGAGRSPGAKLVYPVAPLDGDDVPDRARRAITTASASPATAAPPQIAQRSLEDAGGLVASAGSGGFADTEPPTPRYPGSASPQPASPPSEKAALCGRWPFGAAGF